MAVCYSLDSVVTFNSCLKRFSTERFISLKLESYSTANCIHRQLIEAESYSGLLLQSKLLPSLYTSIMKLFLEFISLLVTATISMMEII